MKNYRVLLSLTILILASIACQTTSSSDVISAEPDSESGLDTGSSNPYKGEWPIPEGAYFIKEFGRNLHFQVDMSQNDIVDFYQTEFQARGYKDIPISSDYDGSDGYVYIVFDGHESGNQINVTLQDRDSNSIYVIIGFVVGN